ncbi:MAG: hypothetical protein H0U94_10830, partial [Acidobacteria bacterium]|nr:hypothetical protein [Acidobacteriota bacterium]
MEAAVPGGAEGAGNPRYREAQEEVLTPPAVKTRDAEGRVTVRAVRISTPPRIDGLLDEAMYTTLPPITDFIQQEPDEGQVATEPTLVWITFDD